MSTKRKAENHLRSPSQARMMKYPKDTRMDSERDSGFSDASSEHMSTMDTAAEEDSHHSFPQLGQATGSGSKPSQLAVVGGSYPGLSPMIIMNNVLLKQPVENPPPLKPWRFSPTVEMVQPVVQQPQVVFIQPVVSCQASPASKETSSKHKRSKKYLPILKSYPKIAPHPKDNTSSSERGTASSSSSSSGSDRCSTLMSSQWDNVQREKTRKTLCGNKSNSGSSTPSLPATPSAMSPLFQSSLSLPATETSNSSSPARERPSSAISQAEFISSLSFSSNSGSKDPTFAVAQAIPHDNSSLGDCSLSGSDSDTKRKRFCNTYNILSKSGLLDITLRTKELLRQNRRTQNDLDKLKEHTDLFLQALRSGDTSICVKLQANLQEQEQEPGSEQLKNRLDLL